MVSNKWNSFYQKEWLPLKETISTKSDSFYWTKWLPPQWMTSNERNGSQLKRGFLLKKWLPPKGMIFSKMIGFQLFFFSILLFSINWESILNCYFAIQKSSLKRKRKFFFTVNVNIQKIFHKNISKIFFFFFVILL